MVRQRVMVHMLSELQGKHWKFAWPHHQPFHVIFLMVTNAKAYLLYIHASSVLLAYTPIV